MILSLSILSDSTSSSTLIESVRCVCAALTPVDFNPNTPEFSPRVRERERDNATPLTSEVEWKSELESRFEGVGADCISSIVT